MGLADFFNSVTEKAWRNCPNVAQPFGNACWSSYNLGRATVLKIDGLVRINGSQKLKGYIPGPEARQKIGVYAFNILDSPLGKEGLKLIPGASVVYETYRWFQSDKTEGEETGAQKLEAYAHLKYEKKELPKQKLMAETPEDVLSDFIQNGSLGRAFLDSLFVPNVGTSKSHQQEGTSLGF